MSLQALAIAEKIHRRTLLNLALFTLGSMLLTILGEVVKTRLLWYIRYADLVDLLLVAPLYVTALLLFHEQFARTGVSRRLRLAFLLVSFVFLYGHSMHVTGNIINTFSTEIRDYEAVLPEDTYALIYFLDETLSHIVVFVSRYLLFALLLVAEARFWRAPVGRTLLGLAGLSGMIYGAWEAVVFVEGQKVVLLPILLLLLGVVWLAMWRRHEMTLADFARSGPVALFVVTLAAGIFVGLAVYWLVVGGFTEPSDLIALGWLPLH